MGRERSGFATVSALALVAMTGTALAIGCGSSDASVDKGSNLPAGVKSTSIDHEDCSTGGHRVEMIDVNNDGKPDIRRVFDGQVEICRITDLNRDGKADLYEYYDKTGMLRRREADYDDNGIINAIEYYENGKLVRRELDTTNQGRIDTWDYFDPNTGQRIKRERDSTGDGRLDQWWTYSGDKVTIAMDRNGDGQPDPESTIELGGSSGAPSGTAADAGVASNADAASAPPPPPPPPSTSEPTPTSPTPDAGPKKPTRGGAKR